MCAPQGATRPSMRRRRGGRVAQAGAPVKKRRPVGAIPPGAAGSATPAQAGRFTNLDLLARVVSALLRIPLRRGAGFAHRLQGYVWRAYPLAVFRHEQNQKRRVAPVLRGMVGEIWKCLKSLGLDRNARNTVLVERTKRKLQETLIL
jgi:hypothetical protein